MHFKLSLLRYTYNHEQNNVEIERHVVGSHNRQPTCIILISLFIANDLLFHVRYKFRPRA